MRLHITIDGPVKVEAPAITAQLERMNETLQSIDESLQRLAETAQEPPKATELTGSTTDIPR